MQYLTRLDSGILLMIGVVIMIITMVLHPAGGSFEGLIQNASIAIIAHSLAIGSVPFSALGFWGLTRSLQATTRWSYLGYAFMIVGLLAAMLAAALNGLAQPMFALRYADASSEVIDQIRPIFHYNMALNHAFDYVLMASLLASMLCWSISILKTKVYPRWTGILGITLVLLVAVGLYSGFYFLDLYGFRYFVFGWLIWVVSVGVYLMSHNQGM